MNYRIVSRIKTGHLFFLGIYAAASFAMEQDIQFHTLPSAEDSKIASLLTLKEDPQFQFQLRLMQRIYAALGIEKSPTECEAMLKLARRRDREAALTRLPHNIPLAAPWRDSYMTQMRTVIANNGTSAAPTQSPVASSANASAPKKICVFDDQFSRPSDDPKNNIVQRHSDVVEMLNLNPYAVLHYLLNPLACETQWENLPQQTQYQLLERAQSLTIRLQELGINSVEFFFNLLDPCAGKTVDHIHGHFLPRIKGDTLAIASLIAADIIKQERRRLTDQELKEGRSTVWYALKNWDKKALADLYVPYVQLLSSMHIPYYPEPISDPCHACEVVRDTAEDTVIANNGTSAAPTQSPVASSANASAPKKICVFDDQFSRPSDDPKNNIVQRHSDVVEMLNLNPYAVLHYLLNPLACETQWENLPQQTQYQLLERAQSLTIRLQELGINSVEFFFNLLDPCAGKTVDHIHGHFLPRIKGDTLAIASLIAADIIKQERRRLTDQELKEGRSTVWYALKNWDKKALADLYVPYVQLLSSMHIPYYPEPISDPCHACEVVRDTAEDAENLVVMRFDKDWILRLLRFGYMGGHLRLYNTTHGKSFTKLNQAELQRFSALIALSQKKIQDVLKQRGLNIAILEGKDARNTHPDHACCEIAPRHLTQVSATTIFNGNSIGDINLEVLRKRMIESFNSK